MRGRSERFRKGSEKARARPRCGAEAGEVMAAMQTAILGGLSYQKLRDAVISHLTYAEGLGPLLSNVPARAAG